MFLCCLCLHVLEYFLYFICFWHVTSHTFEPSCICAICWHAVLYLGGLAGRGAAHTQKVFYPSIGVSGVMLAKMPRKADESMTTNDKIKTVAEDSPRPSSSTQRAPDDPNEEPKLETSSAPHFFTFVHSHFIIIQYHSKIIP